MRIAGCRMRIEKEYNSEIRNPKSQIGWPMPAAQSGFHSEPLKGFQKIFEQLY